MGLVGTIQTNEYVKTVHAREYRYNFPDQCDPTITAFSPFVKHILGIRLSSLLPLFTQVGNLARAMKTKQSPKTNRLHTDRRTGSLTVAARSNI